MTPCNLAKLKQNLQSERDAFDKLAKTPNTLERNVELATHRQEIARMEKLLKKQSAKPAAGRSDKAIAACADLIIPLLAP